jgi:hypothetical protein
MWTMENTEGFTQPELDMINDVRSTLLDGFTGEAYSIDDAINNAWFEGIDRDRLARAAMNRLIG